MSQLVGFLTVQSLLMLPFLHERDVGLSIILFAFEMKMEKGK